MSQCTPATNFGLPPRLKVGLDGLNGRRAMRPRHTLHEITSNQRRYGCVTRLSAVPAIGGRHQNCVPQWGEPQVVEPERVAPLMAQGASTGPTAIGEGPTKGVALIEPISVQILECVRAQRCCRSDRRARDGSALGRPDYQTSLRPARFTTVGFGAPGNPSVVDQPWGHLKAETGPIPPGRAGDNPPVFGPGGTVHCSIADSITYATMHARGDNGESGLFQHLPGRSEPGPDQPGSRRWTTS